MLNPSALNTSETIFNVLSVGNFAKLYSPCPLRSIIFSYALQHLPERDNEISALMIMGVSGGALITPLMGVLSDALGQVAGLSLLLLCLLYLGWISFRLQKRKKNV